MPRATLVELNVSQLGPIGNAQLLLTDGLTVITGETGAGKTLLIGALQLCTGASDARNSSDGDLRASTLFVDDEKKEVLLTREVTDGGRLRSLLNGATASVEQLREISRSLVEIHGQHDSLRLRNKAELLALIDRSGSCNSYEFDGATKRLRQLLNQRESVGGTEDDLRRRIEFLSFQIDEFNRIKPTSPQELSESILRLETITEISKMSESLLRAADLLDGDDDGNAAQTTSAALQLLGRAAHLGDLPQRINGAVEELRSVAQDLRRIGDSGEVDSSEIDRLNQRVGELRNLNRRFGGDLSDAFVAIEALKIELAGAEESLRNFANLDELVVAAQDEVDRESALLKSQRQLAAAEFSQGVQKELTRVALPHALFDVEVNGSDGSDVTFWFRPNPGHNPSPIHQVASGGELSRLMLAIALNSGSPDSCAIFDEIDAGIGGGVAQSIGSCLQELARRQQVIVVTHLASVAAVATRHWVVEKSSDGDSTTTTVRRVEGDERVSEIARMLAGSADNTESLALARRLLEDAILNR